MAQDDGSVHDVPGRQHHRVSHKSVHQRVCCHKLTENIYNGTFGAVVSTTASPKEGCWFNTQLKQPFSVTLVHSLCVCVSSFPLTIKSIQVRLVDSSL